MNTEKMREEFERAYMRDLVGHSLSAGCEWLERGSDGEYRSFHARGAWWSWQASRAAIEVELPYDSDALNGDHDFIKGWRLGVSDMIDSIESLGLKVKP